MSNEIYYPTPQELADYLRTPGLKKARGQFANEIGGRCCLGHYADMCGLEYDEDQGLFESAAEPENDDYAQLTVWHWLFDGLAGERIVQGYLARVNDTTEGFDEIIKILEGL